MLLMLPYQGRNNTHTHTDCLIMVVECGMGNIDGVKKNNSFCLVVDGLNFELLLFIDSP